MALPHPGVVSASIDPANGIQQPDQLNGQGLYSIRASVPVPFVNVICLSNLAADELKPLIYSDWDDAKKLDPVNVPPILSLLRESQVPCDSSSLMPFNCRDE